MQISRSALVSHAAIGLATPAKPTAAGNPTSATGNSGSTNQAAQIVRKYDLHNISYSEVEKMSMELQRAGVIPDGQLLDYLPPPEGQFSMKDGKLVFDGGEKHDFLKSLNNHLAYVEQHQADFSTIIQVRRMVDFYRNLDALGAD